MKAFLTGRTPERSAESDAGPRARRPSAPSSTVAIGTATFVVALAAAMGLALDRPPPAAPEIGAGWHLRGALGAAAPHIGRV